MAIYYLRVRTFGRSQGKSGSRATSAAAYRSGERIRDERTRRVYDYRRRTDVIHKEIVLPVQLAGQRASLAWARDRTKLWNAAEHAESRRNSRVAREFVVALPHELEPSARVQLATRFAQEIAGRYGSAVDVAIHAPRGDAHNFHAHLLATTREITPNGLGRKTTLELSGTQRHELGLPRWREEIRSLRENWEHLTNDALERAQVAARVTHLSRAERGLAASGAPPRVPLAAYYMERRGERSFIAEKIRERHRTDLERPQAEQGRRALKQSKFDRRKPFLPSSEQALATVGRSMLHEIGAGVRAAWQRLQDKLGARLTARREVSAALESSLVSAPMHKGPAVAIERQHEGSHPMTTPAQLRADAVRRGARVDELELKSAHDWLANRENQRRRSAAGLEESGPDAANESGPRGHGHGHEPRRELGPNHEPGHSRGHADDLGL